MDALSDERGQAIVLVAIALAIGVVSVVGLREAQERMLTATRSHRAGEAAVEAAAATLADAYVARVRVAADERGSPPITVQELVRDSGVIANAQAAANELARHNGAGPTGPVAAQCVDGRIEATLVLDGFTHRAGFAATECSRR